MKKFTSSILAFAIPSSINLLSLLVFTRLLSIENYGKFSIALISIEFLVGIFYSWIKMGMMRFYKTEINSFAIGVQFCLLISLLLIVAGAIIFTTNIFADSNFIVLIISGVIGRGIAAFIQDYTRISNESLKKYTITCLVFTVAYYIPAIVFIIANKYATVNQLLLVQMLGLLSCLSIICISNLGRIRTKLKDVFSKIHYVEFLKYAIPIVAITISYSMFIRVDRYIIEHNLGLKELGIFSAAFSLANLAISSFFSVLTLPTYPDIIRKMNEGNDEGAKKTFKQNGNLILLIALPVLITSCLFSSQLCQLFFGEKGQMIAGIFNIVVIATFCYNLRLNYFDQIYQFGKRTKMQTGLCTGLGIGHLVLCYFLSLRFGLYGVAISGISINCLGMLFSYFYSKSFFSIEFNFRKVVAAVVLCVPSLIVWFIVNHYFHIMS